MTKIYLVLIIIGFVACQSQPKETETPRDTQVVLTNKTPVIQNGDIIFQVSLSSQSQAIQLATHSKYSHMGIIYQENNQLWVYEATSTVKLTPFEEWIQQGKDKHYVIKRLKNADKHLTANVLKKMKQVGEKYKGKPYDIYFGWSDERLYCSELVWKIYQQAAQIEIGKLQKLSSFDLSSEVVKAKMKERYGNQIPLNELVISPAEMFQSEKLIVVESK